MPTAAGAPIIPQPRRQQRRSLYALLNVAVDHAQLLSYILIAVGLLGLLALPLLERKIEFDENALLAGSAQPTIRSKSPDAYRVGKALAASLQNSLFSSSFTAALQHQLQQHLPGVQVYNHTFTVASWESSSNGGDGSDVRTCTNVHVVLNAQRGDGKEALLLGTPINHQEFSKDFEQDASGALLALSLGGVLLQHLTSSAPWLAKEVVWLLPDASCGLVDSVQAWADAYQYPPLSDPTLQHFGRAGVLQQAVLLELPSGTLNTLQVSLESYEGLLPKLDMFWLFRWYCHHYVRAPLELTHMGWTLPSSTWQHLTSKMAAVLDPIIPGSGRAVHQAFQAVQQHLLKFTIACQFMWRQARGLPTGAHAPFKGLMVDAATLRTLRKDPNGFVVGPAGFTGATGNSKRSHSSSSSANSLQPQFVLGFDDALMQLSDVVALTLRSCSVLIERFHHSLFLYVLTDLDHYVSVERYIGPLVALICVLAVQAAATQGSPAAATTSRAILAKHMGQLLKGAVQLLPQLSNRAVQRLQQRRARSTGLMQQIAAFFSLVHWLLHHILTVTQHGWEPAEEEEPIKLQPVDILQLPSQEVAAAARTRWVVAIKLTIAVHVVAAAAGYAARTSPMLLPLLQHPGRAAVWLEAAAEAPAEHASKLVVGCGLLLALLAAAEGFASVTDGSVCSVEQVQERGDGCTSSWQDLRRKVLALEYSAAAAACAAAACLNWALGYVMCLVLVPLAVGCSPPPLPQNTSTGSSSISSTRILWCWITLISTAPPVVLLVLGVLSGGAAAGGVQWLSALVLHSSAGAFMAFWGVLVPFWCVTVFAVAAA